MKISGSKLIPLSVVPLALLILNGCSEAPARTATSQTAIQKIERPVQIMLLDDSQQTNVRRFSGVLEATNTAHLAFKVPGTIAAILVKTGDSVEKGQLLARLDPHDYQVNVIELKARQAEAEAAFQLAKAELKRVKQAIADDAISQVNLDRAKSGYKRSLAMRDVMTQNLQKAQDALAYTELKAPFSGVIGSKAQQAFEQTAPGNPLFSLHQLGEMKAVIDVPENLMLALDPQQAAQVSWHGETKAIMASLSAKDALADPIKQTYQVEFVLNQTTKALPGKAVSVEVGFDAKSASFCVPYGAIINEGSKKSVYLIKEHRAVKTPVTLDSLQSNSACLTGALSAGDAVVTAGVHYLKADQVVSYTVTKAFSY
ncbi:efflux RND transporter periplasmic adaptor subunit [Shewanella pneumatophori]|uniref:Efflux RND transporter periplasmic adaptor subunit n=1 Tax=Shewanella pneumatophori TaxID=314092 RepID=A0A9X2CBU3_9GAMM|nr:efflux RND transporter periplasmic adaptor subunit [Shewanella pneumatophori]MCL1137178.1 efflux RND transporter periplasmic adaptor subunit [Shewanella pneumatophori]